MVSVGHHENITLLSHSEVESVSGYVGNYEVRVRRNARFIDEELCTGCGKCAEVCPIEVSNTFDLGLSNRKAAYRHSAQQIAFNEVGRQSIMADPDFNGGDYYDRKSPERGLAVARMVGHITYMSDDSMREKFGRRLRRMTESKEIFEVESYLRYRGGQFVSRFDANSYIAITRAMDTFDVGAGYVGQLIGDFGGCDEPSGAGCIHHELEHGPHQRAGLQREHVRGLFAQRRLQIALSQCDAVQRDASGGHDALNRDAFDGGERGAQRLVSAHDLGQAALERRDVELAAQAERDG